MMPCLEPGCPVLVERGRCERHRKERSSAYNRAYDRRRPNANRRGYTRRWRAASAAYLAAHPICEGCGREPSRVTDHIIPISDGGARMDSANWQALGWRCHEAKKARERRARSGP